MTLRCSLMVLVTVLSMSDAIGQSTTSYEDAAKSIAGIAQASDYSDHKLLAKELKLPELPDKIVWRGPQTTNVLNNDFIAIYEPSESLFGVEKVIIRWQFWGARYDAFKHEARKHVGVKIAFRSTACPSETLLEEAMGSKGKKVSYPNSDGHSWSTSTEFTFPRQNGEPVKVSYGGSNTCYIDIERWSPL